MKYLMGHPLNTNSLMSSSKKLQDEVEKTGTKVRQHEDNIKFLKAQENQLDDAIIDLQVSLGKSCSRENKRPKTEDGDTSHGRSAEETVEQILKQEKSAAGIFCQLKSRHSSQLRILTLSEEVLGVVATLGKVDDDNLSRLFSEYLGLQTMLAIVCKTYEGIKALEIYDGKGLVNQGSGIHGLGASIGRALEGRFLAICLDNLRPYAGEIIADDPQRRLDIPKPRLPNGEIPAGFLGFAVNMVHVDRIHLYCSTSSGCGLRETLFYNLFSRLQVYRTRAEMVVALSCISDGAVSLDGGMIRASGVFSLGGREDIDVRFPKYSEIGGLPERYYELENQLKMKLWEKERLQEDIRREQVLLEQEKHNFELRKEEFQKFLTERSSLANQGHTFAKPTSGEVDDYKRTSVSKLKRHELNMVEKLMEDNMRPKQILNTLKKLDDSNSVTIRQIHYAILKIKRRKMGDLTFIQYLFKMLKDENYVYRERTEPNSHVLCDLIFVHPKSLRLLSLFPYVLVMNATYKTNRYLLPLVEIVGFTPIGKNFHVAFAFMKDEKTESFVWLLEQFKSILGEGRMPSVIVTDRELADMNAIVEVFPDVSHMLCKRHISINLEINLERIMGETKYWFAFKNRWTAIVQSQTHTEYVQKVGEMTEAWGTLKVFVDYVKEQWLDPHHEKFVAAWTKEYLHFGAETTNKKEGSYSKLQRCLSTAVASLHCIFPKIHSLVELQLQEIMAEFEISRTVTLHITSIPLFQLLSCRVSHLAIERLHLEWMTWGRIVSINSEQCTCELFTSYGLPCACRMIELVNSQKAIDPDKDVHVFWSTLSVDANYLPRSSNASIVEAFHKSIRKTRGNDAAMKWFIDMKCYIDNSHATDIEPPIVRKHKGRPKPKSTRRDLT